MKRTGLHPGRLLLALMVVIVLAVLTACAAKETPKPKPSPPPPLILPSVEPLPTGKAKLEAIKQEGPPGIDLISPTEGQVIPSTFAFIMLRPFNFNYLTRSPGYNVDGAGKVAFYMDVEPPTEAGKKALTAKGTYTLKNSDNEIWRNLKPGKHTLYVQLLNYDDTPLSPPVVVKVSFVMAPESPAP